VELDASGKLLRAALGFLSLEPREPVLVALRRCFDNWRGIGDVGSASAPSPWAAVQQRAALDALLKRNAPEALPRDWTATDESPR
jgi:hypothetical protein